MEAHQSMSENTNSDMRKKTKQSTIPLSMEIYDVISQ